MHSDNQACHKGFQKTSHNDYLNTDESEQTVDKFVDKKAGVISPD